MPISAPKCHAHQLFRLLHNPTLKGKPGSFTVQSPIAGGLETSGLYTVPVETGWRAEQYTIRFRISDFCLASVRRDALVRQIHFTDHRGSVDEIALPGHPAPSRGIYYVPSVPVDTEPPRIAPASGLLRYCLRRYHRHFIRLAEGGFENYLTKFGSKSRNTLKRKVKAWAARSSAPSLRVFHRPEQMDDYVRFCRQISARTYQEILSGDGFPQEPAFAAQLRRLAAAGRVRGYLLFDNGHPAAYAHCTVPEHAPHVLHYDTVGYDPDDRQWSPGTVLLYHIIEDLYTLGRFQLFDFGIGDHSYKRFFSTGSVRAVDLLYFPWSPANCAVVANHCALAALTRTAGKIADWTGLADRLKRKLRGMAG